MEDESEVGSDCLIKPFQNMLTSFIRVLEAQLIHNVLLSFLFEQSRDLSSLHKLVNVLIHAWIRHLEVTHQEDQFLLLNSCLKVEISQLIRPTF